MIAVSTFTHNIHYLVPTAIGSVLHLTALYSQVFYQIFTLRSFAYLLVIEFEIISYEESKSAKKSHKREVYVQMKASLPGHQ